MLTNSPIELLVMPLRDLIGIFRSMFELGRAQALVNLYEWFVLMYVKIYETFLDANISNYANIISPGEDYVDLLIAKMAR